MTTTKFAFLALIIFFCMQLIASDVAPKTTEYFVVFGASGVGKSTVINSLLKKNAALTGISSDGLTKTSQAYSFASGCQFLDTPSLSNIMNCSKDAQEIEQALKMDGHYRIFFILTLEAGRLRAQDIDNILLIMELIKNEDKNFNVIINKVTRKEINQIFKVNTAFSVLCQTIRNGHEGCDKIIWIEKDRLLEDGVREWILLSSKTRSALLFETGGFTLRKTMVIGVKAACERVFEQHLQDRIATQTEELRLLQASCQALQPVDWTIGRTLSGEERAMVDLCVQEIYKTIVDSQIKQSEYDHECGAWPAVVTARGMDVGEIRDANFFTALQTSLSLTRTSKRLSLPGLSEVNRNLVMLAEKYIMDTSLSQRKIGSVCFWPYIEKTSGEFIHGIAPDAVLLQLFNNVDLPNDFDTSSRLALFLINEQSGRKFAEDFVRASHEAVTPAMQCYPTWVQDAPPGNGDYVVNLNILAALWRWKKECELSFEAKHAMEKSCAFVNGAIANNVLLDCMEYYDRPSEIFLSYSLAIREGVAGLFQSLPAMQQLIHREAKLAFLDPTTPPTELAEYMISIYNMALVAKDIPLVRGMTTSLGQKLLARIWVPGVGFKPSRSSVYIGRFKEDTFDWECEAYSSALFLEALSIIGAGQ
jgi:GTP-binding protein EngB required for normal cell division